MSIGVEMAAPLGTKTTDTNASHQTAHQNITIATPAKTAGAAYVNASGRSGTIHYFDPMGTDYTSSNPPQDFIDAFTMNLKHELMHGLRLADGGGCGSSIMSGYEVPNNKHANGGSCEPNNPGPCDAVQLKSVYPPTPEEDGMTHTESPQHTFRSTSSTTSISVSVSS
jgi:hypothetical protein